MIIPHDHEDITKLTIGCKACIQWRIADQALARIAEMPEVQIEASWTASASGKTIVSVKGDPSTEDVYEVADRNESTILAQIESQADIGFDTEIDWDVVRWVAA